MKKSIIAAGAASVALAAMPIVGAFAATETVKDSVTATVTAGCAITNPADSQPAGSTVATNTVAVSATPGGAAGVSNPDASGYNGITVACNSSNWSVSAIGGTTGATNTSLYYNDGTTNHEIATGTAASTEISGDSYWAFKIASLSTSDGVAVASGYGVFTTIPETPTPVVNGTKSANVTIKPQYQVYANSTQASGAYTGAVVYTVAVNTGSGS